MMNKIFFEKYKYTPVLLMGCLIAFLASCNSDNSGLDSNDGKGTKVESISVVISKQFPAHNLLNDDTINDGDPDNGSEENKEWDDYDYTDFDIDALIPFHSGFDETSIIQVSQQTRDREPFKTDEDIFDFKYFNNENAHWEDEPELTYNFSSYLQKIPLEWNYIGSGDSFRGGFAMYALYFPIENKIRQSIVDNKIRYSVMQDQSILENLIKSDILGAYHSTEKLQSRIRFKMFHLMIYFRIRLYVPLFNKEKNTGYRENALQYATIDNVNHEFAINWLYSLNTDEAPSVDPIEGESYIIMYQHPLKEGQTNHPVVKLPYKKFITPDYYDQGIEGDLDDVRIYDFSVIVPYQFSKLGSDGKQHNFTETDFLNFYFRTNSGATTRYYFNQSNYAIDDSGNTEDQMENTLEMRQGVFQYLQLYVPRVGNQLIYLGGNINPWVQMGSNVQLEEPSQNN